MKIRPILVSSLVFARAAAPDLIAADPAKKAAEKQPEAPAAAPFEIKDPVAVVEGVEIKKADLDAALANMMAQSGQAGVEIPTEQKAGAYRMILDDLIIERLIAKRSAAVQIPDEEVDATFKRFTANFGSEDEIKSQIEKNGQTVAKVKDDIRANLRQQRWVNDQIKGAEVSDADAEDFYKKNPEQFKMPERVRASHILVVVEPGAKPEAVIEKEKAAQAILARVKKGEDFNKLAKELSEDPSAKENSGDLDFFTKDQMVPEFSNAAFKMKEDEVSEPVRSQFGYHIIKVTGHKDAETVPLEKAKPQVLAYLKQQKKQEQVEQLVRGIREKADVKINLPAAP